MVIYYGQKPTGDEFGSANAINAASDGNFIIAGSMLMSTV